jgi:hypothetical protein
LWLDINTEKMFIEYKYAYLVTNSLTFKRRGTTMLLSVMRSKIFATAIISLFILGWNVSCASDHPTTMRRTGEERKEYPEHPEDARRTPTIYPEVTEPTENEYAEYIEPEE